MSDEDGKWRCSGTRDYRPKVITTPPILMIENQDVHKNKQHEAVSKMTTMRSIDSEIFLNGERYVLIQVFLANHTHFRSVIVVRGRYLWYDGIGQSGPRMKWINKNNDFLGQKKDGYFVSCLWYRHIGSSRGHTQDSIGKSEELASFNPRSFGGGDKREGASGKDDTTSETVNSSGSATSIGNGVNDKLPSNNVGNVVNGKRTANNKKDGKEKAITSPQLNVESKPKSTNKKRKRNTSSQNSNEAKAKKKKLSRTSYPMGVSISSVSNFSKPKCGYCRACMKTVGEWHVVKKVRDERNRTWMIPIHYHFKCSLNVLSPEEKEQLLAIVNASDVVGASKKEEIINVING